MYVSVLANARVSVKLPWIIWLTHGGRVTHICIYASLSLPSLVQIMGCRLVGTKPHYLKQYRNIIDWTLNNIIKWNLYCNSYIFNQGSAFEISVCEMVSMCLNESLETTKNYIKDKKNITHSRQYFFKPTELCVGFGSILLQYFN